MRNFLLRVLYAALGVVMFWLVFPLFLSVIGFAPGADLLQLLRVVVALLAVLYALVGPAPPVPWW